MFFQLELVPLTDERKKPHFLGVLFKISNKHPRRFHIGVPPQEGREVCPTSFKMFSNVNALSCVDFLKSPSSCLFSNRSAASQP